MKAIFCETHQHDIPMTDKIWSCHGSHALDARQAIWHSLNNLVLDSFRVRKNGGHIDLKLVTHLHEALEELRKLATVRPVISPPLTVFDTEAVRAG